MENVWQFIAGGGEDRETPLESAIRETTEESGISAQHTVRQLKATDYGANVSFL